MQNKIFITNKQLNSPIANIIQNIFYIIIKANTIDILKSLLCSNNTIKRYYFYGKFYLIKCQLSNNTTYKMTTYIMKITANFLSKFFLNFFSYYMCHL